MRPRRETPDWLRHMPPDRPSRMYVELVWAAICIGLAAIICTFILIRRWFQ